MTDHLDKRKFTRKGFFKKKEKANPLRSYQTECKNGGRGYLAYRSEAHHVLPFEAIDTAALESAEDADQLRYIRDVQYITDWNLNHPKNLVGLPNIICYDLYYQNKINPKIPYSSVANLYNKFMKKKSKKRRREIVSEIQSNSPEGWPIHNPSNWGHSAYTAEVIQEIKVNVWDPIKSNKKKHEIDAKTVKSELEGWADENYNWLANRGKGSALLWAKRLDPTDTTNWYKPYTMYDVDNPIFG